MKKLILLSIAALTMVGCKPEPTASIGEPGSKVEGINATWTLVAAQIVDNNTINGDSISLTDYYTEEGSPEITFNSGDGSYTVVDAGKRNFFGGGGTWEFDNPDYPTIINLTTSEGAEHTLVLTSTIRPQDPRLRINYERACDDKAYATYYFEYIRK